MNWWEWFEVPSVWAIEDDEGWDPNTWSPPSESPWARDRSLSGGRASWTEPGGWSIEWAPENGRGSGRLAMAA